MRGAWSHVGCARTINHECVRARVSWVRDLKGLAGHMIMHVQDLGARVPCEGASHAMRVCPGAHLGSGSLLLGARE
jgi:hypothetical protein